MGGGSSDNRRRPKAAFFLLACGVAGVLPHGLGPLGRLLPALGLAGLLGVYVVRAVFLSGNAIGDEGAMCFGVALKARRHNLLQCSNNAPCCSDVQPAASPLCTRLAVALPL